MTDKTETSESLSSAERPAGVADPENPWPGLASFTESDSPFFHGRNDEAEELLRLIRRDSLTMLYGQSGLGKTSLLQAGLFPKLRDECFLPVPVRIVYSDTALAPEEQIRDALADALWAAEIDAFAPRDGASLWAYLHRRDIELWNSRNRLITPVFVLDQFEEVFTLGRSTPGTRIRAKAFLDWLADLAENRPPIDFQAKLEAGELDASAFDFGRGAAKIVICLREDFLAELDGLGGRMRGITANRFRLRRMSGEHAVRAVCMGGVGLVEADVARRVVEFVAAKTSREGQSDQAAATEFGLAEVEPSLLSVVCRELNNQRKDRRLPRITFELLASRSTEILTDFYERSLVGMTPGARFFIEDKLLTKGGFRDSVALENALSEGGIGLTRQQLDLLVNRRLLRIDDRLGQQRVELTHDLLLEPARASREIRRRQHQAFKETGLLEAYKYDSENRIDRPPDAENAESAARSTGLLITFALGTAISSIATLLIESTESIHTDSGKIFLSATSFSLSLLTLSATNSTSSARRQILFPIALLASSLFQLSIEFNDGIHASTDKKVALISMVAMSLLVVAAKVISLSSRQQPNDRWYGLSSDLQWEALNAELSLAELYIKFEKYNDASTAYTRALDLRRSYENPRQSLGRLDSRFMSLYWKITTKKSLR
jgi:hypothetical protein